MLKREKYLSQIRDFYDKDIIKIITGIRRSGKSVLLNTNKKAQYGAYLENIVFNELLYRGYEVSIGNNNGKEIDFVATKYNQKEYYQVCYYLNDEQVVEREFGAYSDINDNYPKYVISMDELDFSQNGIIHKNIIDWLLTKQ